MKKIIVTGGLGFIGSNFIIKLIQDPSYKILNIDKKTEVSIPESLSFLKHNSNYSFIKCDIRNKDKLKDIINKFKPLYVVHFAAESHVDNSISFPNKFIESNINGTFNLINICNNLWMKKKLYINSKFIHISTDEVYGSLNRNDKPFNELSSYKPNSPYSASKASSDFLVRSWNQTYGFNSIIANCSNNYGPWQHPEKLIPKIILNAINRKQIPIYGKGKNVRDWIHVDDHVNALIKILKKGKIGEKYNIGGRNEKTNISIAMLICDLLDEIYDNGYSHKKLIKYVVDRPGHDFRYAVNDSKIRTRLNFKNKIDFKYGIKHTIKWYIKKNKFFSTKFKI